MQITVKSDGSAKPVGDGHYHGAYGFVIREDGWKTHEENGYLHSTKSVDGVYPEFQAAIKALEYVQKQNYGIGDEVVLKTDNPTVYQRLNDNPILMHIVPEVNVEKVNREDIYEAHYAAAEVWDKKLGEVRQVAAIPSSLSDFFHGPEVMEVS